MIVDCYTHVWDSPSMLGRSVATRWRRDVRHDGSEVLESAGIEQHLLASRPVDASIVVGFVSAHLHARIPNERIAEYVGRQPTRVFGFAGIDPSDPREALDEIARARDELGLVGIAVAPPAQNFHPSDSRAMRVYARAVELAMPVLFHAGIRIEPETRLDYARPFLLDEVAREFPEMRMVVAHMGLPWVDETLFLLAKHEHVYAEISGLLRHPWQAYQALSSAYEQGVMDKLLFGSGFPFSTPAQCIETLFSINQLCQGTNLPVVPRDQLRAILHRDALQLLGLSVPRASGDTDTAAAASPAMD